MSGIQSPRPGAPGTRQTGKSREGSQAFGPASKRRTSPGRLSARPRAPAEPESMPSREAGDEGLSPMGSISPEQWRTMVAEAAYYRAQRRGFSGGSAEQDWFEAEEEIRRSLEER